MEEAVQAMQNLAQQCSDFSAMQDIVTHLFKILGGQIKSNSHIDWLTELRFCVPDVWCLSLQGLRESSQLLPRR